MIARLRGVLARKDPGRVILDVNGVGYEAVISLTTFAALPDTGETVLLKIHTHVREDALTLFGFVTDGEKALFERLIGVSGVGPKLAITVLSGLSAAEVAQAIRGGKTAALQSIPGIGRKTAERIIVELRDRVAGLPGDGEDGDGAPGGAGTGGDPVEDAVSALVNLGYREPDARTAVRRAVPADDMSQLLRKALSSLAAGGPRPS